MPRNLRTQLPQHRCSHAPAIPLISRSGDASSAGRMRRIAVSLCAVVLCWPQMRAMPVRPEMPVRAALCSTAAISATPTRRARPAEWAGPVRRGRPQSRHLSGLRLFGGDEEGWTRLDGSEARRFYLADPQKATVPGKQYAPCRVFRSLQQRADIAAYLGDAEMNMAKDWVAERRKAWNCAMHPNISVLDALALRLKAELRARIDDGAGRMPSFGAAFARKAAEYAILARVSHGGQDLRKAMKILVPTSSG